MWIPGTMKPCPFSIICLKDSAAFKPDHQVLAAILKSCSALLAANLGKCLHSYVVKQGSSKHDVDVMRVFRTMHMSGKAMPNSVTVATLLPVCARSGNLKAGKSVHGYIIKSGFEEDAFAGLAENGLLEEAFSFFRSMVKGPIQPNYATIANILPVCASFDDIAAYCSGRQIHSYVLQWPELSGDISACNALMSFYLKIRRTKEAESLFWAMNARDLVSWKAIIAGYASNGEWLKALYLFGNLASLETLLLDSVTMVSILPACAQLESLLVGKQVHAYFQTSFSF